MESCVSRFTQIQCASEENQSATLSIFEYLQRNHLVLPSQTVSSHIDLKWTAIIRLNSGSLAHKWKIKNEPSSLCDLIY